MKTAYASVMIPMTLPVVERGLSAQESSVMQVLLPNMAWENMIVET